MFREEIDMAGIFSGRKSPSNRSLNCLQYSFVCSQEISSREAANIVHNFTIFSG